jgi:hypothetical protein
MMHELLIFGSVAFGALLAIAVVAASDMKLQ